MYDTVHLVLPESRDLVSPYLIHPGSRPIAAAESFSVTLETVVVAEDLDGPFAGDNDILVLTRSSLGARPPCERIHFFGEEIEAGRPLRDLFANLVHVAEDYQGADRLWLEFLVLEVDCDDGERRAAVEAFQALAATAGGVFPVLLPYTFGTAVIAGLMDRVIGALCRDTQVLRVPVAFHGGAPRPGRLPLQEGSFVVFPSATDGAGLRLAPNGVLEENGRPSDRSYLVFNLFAECQVSHTHLSNRRMATLLTQMRDGNAESARRTIEHLRETVAAFADVKRLSRLQELRAKRQPSAAEREMIDTIRGDPRLRPLLAPGAGAATVAVRTF